MPYPYSEYPRQLIDALGVRTSYVTAGKPDGNPILLLHGMTSSSDMYREMMHELENDFWLIAPDIPGFGFSEKSSPFTFPHLVEWLAAFREELDLPPVMIVGHSFGGSLAVSYTLSYPEDVSRLLLAAPAVLVKNMYPDYLKRAGISLGLVDLTTAVSQSKAMIQQQIKLSFFNADLQDESVWERRTRDYELARASADVLKAVAFQDVELGLEKIKQPVCIVWGKDDTVIPVEHGRQLVEIMPDAELVELDECGHILMLEHQSMFHAVSSAFFAGGNVTQAVEAQKSRDAATNGPVISVFGSSAPLPESSAYEEARQLGRLLAQAGFAVATGGYGGTMSAVSQGAAEADGHVIGVTCDQIEQFRPLSPNKWIKEEHRYATLKDRLIHLVSQNEGMIVLPGGIGTLSEMTLAWSFLQVGELEKRPLILLGNSWKETITVFNDEVYVRPNHLELLTFVDTPEAAVRELVDNQ